ncbi:putative aldouronate transport system substrate-binding protein [Paenibacillus endophyticus]|uniref:Putative aldouronate transport system substrate-binding protein n=1 Tax=Paenibacillus endophyticus TaxID=1294268 RepID=A0A7W5CAK5_9BACL|nr:extracellular solute-binding protein [Paenibacillus endophyticus]MBB3154191.1 putative aldouronate transport system substrate-binding protein [Paenibacillus endophyticus]
MKRKSSITLAVIVSLTTVLSACSGNGGNNESPSASTNTEPSASAPASETTNGSQFPLKEKITLKASAHRPVLAPSDFNEQPLLQELEKNTNVHIEWETTVDNDFIEKRNLLLASGSLPDFFFSGRFSDTELVRYGQEGTLIPLNDLIENHMPNLKSILDNRPDIKASIMAPDGNIYALPHGEEIGSGQEEIGANPDFLYINKDWLDKLKLQIPTTIDEFTTVLQAFKKQDPNGNGKADEIPLTYIDNFWTGDIGVLFGAFGVPDKTHRPNNPTYIDHLNVDNGKVTISAQQEGFKQAVSYLSNWFKEGLVDLDAFTHDYDTYFARGKTEDETIGAMIWWDKNDVVGPERSEHWVIVPPFKDMVVKWNSGGGLGRDGAAITKDNKSPEITAAWLDSFFEPTMSAQTRFGPLGVWFDKDASGKLIQKVVENPGELKQKTAITNGIGLLLSEMEDTVAYVEPRAQDRINDSVKYYVPQMQAEKFPNLFFNPEELEVIDRLKPDISAYINKMRAKWLLSGGVEKEWEEFQATLKKMGVEELLKAHQSGYDRYVAAQK